MSDVLVNASGVTKDFRVGKITVNALRGLDLEIRKGDFLAIVGPSGSGKTTLLNLIGALDTATGGTVEVFGQELSEMGRKRRSELRLRSLGFVFQAYNLVPVLTALENVEFVLELQGEDGGRRATALSVLEELGLGELADRRPNAMSGGQQQRVAVARAVASKPRLVLADEPTANLDSENAESLLKMMRELRDKHRHDVRVLDPRPAGGLVRDASRQAARRQGRQRREEELRRAGVRGRERADRQGRGELNGPVRELAMLGDRARRVTVVFLACACALSVAPPAAAVELWSDESRERSLSLNASLKWTSVLSHATVDTVYFPEEWSASSLWRFRLAAEARPAAWLSARVAYEQRARLVSEGAGAGGGASALPSEVPAPYRVRQLDDTLVEVGSTYSYRHELDRASASIAFGRADVTVGRQAVGWGRGLLFGAVDIFAPFSPLESDREWRRGIDAVRVRTPLTDLISADAVAAFGESVEESAYVGRIQGYVGDVDGELFAGSRCEDGFYGGSVSLPVLDAELHAEAAVFVSPEPLLAGGSFGSDDVAVKAVVGGSRTFDVAGGIMLVAEYHYSGFGVAEIANATDHFGDDAFIERYARGDTQILGRHACAAQLSYGFASTTPFSATWIMSPVDGSGVVVPSVVWVFSDSVTLSASAYLAYGAAPEGERILSEYGATPTTGLVQISFYH